MSISGYSDISLIQGTSFSLNSALLDINGNSINLSGCSGIAPIKLYYGNTGIWNQFSLTFPASGNVIGLSMTASGTADLPVGLWPYQLYIMNTGGNVTQYLNGNLNVFPNLTDIIFYTGDPNFSGKC